MKISKEDLLDVIFMLVFIALTVIPFVAYIYPQIYWTSAESYYAPGESFIILGIVLLYAMYVIVLGSVFITIISYEHKSTIE